MRIDESGENNFPFAVDFGDFLAVLLEPGIAEGAFDRTNRDNLPAEAENRAVLDDAEFFKVRATTRAGTGRWRSQRQKLANVCEEQRLTQVEILCEIHPEAV